MNSHDPLSVLAERLIRRAADKTPATLRERLQEEWLADMAVRRGSISRLRFALGCCWAGHMITRELGAPLRAASATGKSAVAIVPHGPAHRSRGTTILMLIVGLHVLVIYGLETGLVRRVFERPPDVMTLTPVKKDPIERTPPAPPSGDLKFTQVVIESPLTRWTPAELTQEAGPLPQGPGAISTQPARPVQRVPGGPGKGFPATEDYYPAGAIRDNERGIATVEVCVDPGGRLIAEPKLAGSSGHARLDQAALRLAKAGSGHYQPTTEDGRPVSACYPYGIRFQLRD